MAAPAAIGAGASLISGMMGNKSAQKAANNDRAQAQQLTQRATQLFDTIFGLAKSNLANLSAQGQIDQLAKDESMFSARDQAGLAGAMRISGYQPGDSEIGIRNDAVRTKYAQDFGRLSNQIRVNAPMQQASLLSMANPGSLNAGLNFWQNQQALDLSRMQNPSSLFASTMPFFGGGGKGFVLQNAVNQGRITPPGGGNPFYR